jgi:hypothetical protein
MVDGTTLATAGGGMLGVSEDELGRVAERMSHFLGIPHRFTQRSLSKARRPGDTRPRQFHRGRRSPPRLRQVARWPLSVTAVLMKSSCNDHHLIMFTGQHLSTWKQGQEMVWRLRVMRFVRRTLRWLVIPVFALALFLSVSIGTETPTANAQVYGFYGSYRYYPAYSYYGYVPYTMGYQRYEPYYGASYYWSFRY